MSILIDKPYRQAYRLMLMIFLITFASSQVLAFDAVSKNKCAKIQGKIDKVHQQMRQKHSAKKSVQLKTRLSGYKDYKYQCMKKRYKTG